MPLPAYPSNAHDFPKSASWLRPVGRFMMWLTGWKTEGELPQGVSKAVVISVPHTSNWDLVYALFASWMYQVKFRWLGKHTLFQGPFGWFLLWLGGVAVDRRAANGLVGQLADAFEQSDGMMLLVPPSGTRTYADRWKSGFYWIAKEANVPIVLGFVDFGQKRAGFGGSFTPTGDIRADMDHIRAFYAPMKGKYPDQQNPVVLSAELEAEVEAPSE